MKPTVTTAQVSHAVRLMREHARQHLDSAFHNRSDTELAKYAANFGPFHGLDGINNFVVRQQFEQMKQPRPRQYAPDGRDITDLSPQEKLEVHYATIWWDRRKPKPDF